MPTNITQGSTVEFTVGFYDANGSVVVPSSATLTMTYTALNGSTASAVIGMTLTGQFYTATWGSGSAFYGMAEYSVMAPGQPKSATGFLRLLNPPSGG